MPVFAAIRKRSEHWQHLLPLEKQTDWEGHASFINDLAAGKFAFAGWTA